MKIRVGIIYGGSSVEHEVSVISALQAIDNIDKDKYDVVPLYISKNREWYTGSSLLNIENYKDVDNLLKKSKKVVLQKINDEFVLLKVNGFLNKIIDKIDIAFPIVHGQNVEDGSLAGYLETLGIPYVGCNVLGAALGQDKIVMKQVFKCSDIPVVDYIWFYDNEYLNNKDKILKDIKKLGYPVVVKPASLGSSVGINYVKDEESIESAINEAITYDKKIIIEKGVENLVEVNCSVVGNYELQEASILEQVMSGNAILTYKDKYVGSSKSKGSSKGIVNTSRIIPAQIDEETTKKVQEISKKVFKCLNLSGVCRIDYLIDSRTNDVYVNEPNTIPGSLAFYLWEPTGKKYSALLDEVIKIGIKEYKSKVKKVTCFDINILKDYKKNSGIKK